MYDYHYSILCDLLPYLKILSRLGAKIYLLVVNRSISSSALDNMLATLCTGTVEHQWIRLANHGEDWSSFHVAYDLGLFESEGVTYKIQTKLSKNLSSDGGSSWIDEALGPICGNQAAVSKVLTQLVVGTHVVASSSSVRRTGFGENLQLVHSFAERVCDTQSKLLENIEFAAGSMFAAEISLIRGFCSAIGRVDYSMEYVDGSTYCGRHLGHALKRVFSTIARIVETVLAPYCGCFNI